jgi:cytochrome c5
MKANQKTALLTVLLLGAAIMLAAAAPARAADGKELFLAQKCNLCHSISVAGVEATTKSEKMKGPDLTGVAAEKGADWVLKFLHKEIDLNGKKHGKELKLTPEETKTLVDWLVAQKKP